MGIRFPAEAQRFKRPPARQNFTMQMWHNGTPGKHEGDVKCFLLIFHERKPHRKQVLITILTWSTKIKGKSLCMFVHEKDTDFLHHV